MFQSIIIRAPSTSRRGSFVAASFSVAAAASVFGAALLFLPADDSVGAHGNSAGSVMGYRGPALVAEPPRASLPASPGLTRSHRERAQTPKPGTILLRSIPKQNCLVLGISSVSECPDIEAIYDSLKEAPLAYNRPQMMTLGQRHELSLVIDPRAGAEPAAGLNLLEGTIVEDTTKISLHMSAELRGRAFEVEPAGLQRRLVSPVALTRWSWFVTPLEAGEDQLITLNVYANIETGTVDLAPLSVRTFRDRIRVDVATWGYVMDIVNELSPVYTFVVAACGTLFGAAAWLWERRPRSRRQRAQ